MTEVEQIIEGALIELARNPLMTTWDKAQLCSRLVDGIIIAHDAFMDQWEREITRPDEGDAA